MDPWDLLLNESPNASSKKESKTEFTSSSKSKPVHQEACMNLIQDNDFDDLLKDIINDKEVGKYTASIKTKPKIDSKMESWDDPMEKSEKV